MTRDDFALVFSVAVLLFVLLGTAQKDDMLECQKGDATFTKYTNTATNPTTGEKVSLNSSTGKWENSGR